MIKLINATRKYNEHTYGIKSINLSLPEKGLILISGESGAGKTTLLNILTASDSMTSGDLYYRGGKIALNDMEDYRRRNVAIVYQDFELISSLTVYDNIALGTGANGEISESKILNILDKLNVHKIKDSLISECSGGEMQRASIGRALAKNTSMIFADEPTGNLDSKNSENIFNILKDISKEKLVVLISHNIDLASKFCDYIIELKDGEIINCTCPDNIISLEEKTGKNFKKARLTSSLLFKLSKWSVGSTKTILNIAIIALIMSLLYIILPLAVYDYPLVLSRNIKTAELPLIYIAPPENNLSALDDIIEEYNIQPFPLVPIGIDNELTEFYILNNLSHQNGMFVNSNNTLAEYGSSLGLEFLYGEAPNEDYEIGISLTKAYNLLSMQYIYNEERELIQITDISQLLGKCFFISDNVMKEIKIIVSGIFNDYYIYRDKQINGEIEEYDSPDIQTARSNFLSGLCVANYRTMSYIYAAQTYPSAYINDEAMIIKPLIQDLSLNVNEVLISQEFAEDKDLISGESLSITMSGKSAVFIVKISTEFFGNSIYINSDRYIDDFNAIETSYHNYILNIGESNQLAKLRFIQKVLEISNNSIQNGYFYSFYPQMTTTNIYDLPQIAENLLEFCYVIFAPIGIALIILLFLSTNALTNYAISESMRNFSILRSIGYSKNNIRKIILVKSLLVALPEIIAGFIIGIILMIIFNMAMSAQTITHIIVLSLDIKNFLIINVIITASYALVLLFKSNSVFKGSAAINYRKSM